MTAALELQSLAAPFGPGPGLTDISFGVAAGERVVIVGGSGAGKTTLLRAIAGLGPATGGRIVIAGRDVSARAPERRDAVYLHQTPLLFPHLSASENVAFPLRVRGVSAAEVDRRVADALAAVKLEAVAGRAPRTLSGGQRHRVALARAVVARPSVLLLDVPFSALVPTLRDEVREALLVLQRTYRPAMVLVTHDLEEAGLLADRIGVLLDGRLAQLAPPPVLFDRPASLAVARFLGIPNLVRGDIRDGWFVSGLGRLPVTSATLPEGPAVVVLGTDGVAISAGGPRGRVVAIQHRPRDTTAIVQLDSMRLEVRVDAGNAPLVGAELPLEIRPRSPVTILPDAGLR